MNDEGRMTSVNVAGLVLLVSCGLGRGNDHVETPWIHLHECASLYVFVVYVQPQSVIATQDTTDVLAWNNKMHIGIYVLTGRLIRPVLLFLGHSNLVFRSIVLSLQVEVFFFSPHATVYNCVMRSISHT